MKQQRLINRKAVREYALELVRGTRPQFTRVSPEFLDQVEHRLRLVIQREILSHPSIGKTLTRK